MFSWLPDYVFILKRTLNQSAPNTGVTDEAHYSSFETMSGSAITDTIEQRWTIKFCIKLDKKPDETAELFKQAYRKSVLL